MSVRVLLVDDILEILEVLDLMYSMIPGVEVVGQARNIKQALEIMEQTPIDLVSIDIYLGYENGFDLCRTLAQTIPDVFITMCASEGTDENRRHGEINGAHFFLQKPIRIEDISDLLKAYSQYQTKVSVRPPLSRI